MHEKSTISSRARGRKAIRQMEYAIQRETETIEREAPSLNWALAFAQCKYVQLQNDQYEVPLY